MQVGQQADEIPGTDGAHDSELERGLLELDEARGELLRLHGLPANLVEIGPHRQAELTQMGARPLAVEQQPAELLLEQLDGARQGRLGHVATLGRAGEVQLLAEGEEVFDLMHFHGDVLLSANGLTAPGPVAPMFCVYRCHRRSALAGVPAPMVECGN